MYLQDKDRLVRTRRELRVDLGRQGPELREALVVVLLALVDRDAQLQQDDAVGEVRALQEELVERRELELQALETLHLNVGAAVVSRFRTRHVRSGHVRPCQVM